jgi:hypothetical protein
MPEPAPVNGKGYESAVQNVVAARLAEMEIAKREKEDDEAEVTAAQELADSSEEAELEAQHKALAIAPMETERLRKKLINSAAIHWRNKKKYEAAAENSRQNLISANAGHDKRRAAQCREHWKAMLTAAVQEGLNAKAAQARLAELPPEPAPPESPKLAAPAKPSDAAKPVAAAAVVPVAPPPVPAPAPAEPAS